MPVKDALYVNLSPPVTNDLPNFVTRVGSEEFESKVVSDLE